MLDRAAALVAEMEGIEQQFRPIGKSMVGRLRVDVPSRIARRFMAPALSGFPEQYPQIDVELGLRDLSASSS